MLLGAARRLTPSSHLRPPTSNIDYLFQCTTLQDRHSHQQEILILLYFKVRGSRFVQSSHSCLYLIWFFLVRTEMSTRAQRFVDSHSYDIPAAGFGFVEAFVGDLEQLGGG